MLRGVIAVAMVAAEAGMDTAAAAVTAATKIEFLNFMTDLLRILSLEYWMST
jgi:hypothetical protein